MFVVTVQNITRLDLVKNKAGVKYVKRIYIIYVLKYFNYIS